MLLQPHAFRPASLLYAGGTYLPLPSRTRLCPPSRPPSLLPVPRS